MSPLETFILVAYFFVLSILGIYGWHRYYLVYEYMKNKHRVPGPPPPMADLPVVTIQLPIFNEMYVVDRLIDAVCDIEYPKDRLEIQVLDDSTDETTAIAEAAVLRARAKGLDIGKPSAMTGRSLLVKKPAKRGRGRNRVLLILLDGWGHRAEAYGNLIASARTPAMDDLKKKYPFTTLEASGEAVGLPRGTVGNSEAGHLTSEPDAESSRTA